jgi:ATP-dependent helicase Lhr and Lhr-like helicase
MSSGLAGSPHAAPPLVDAHLAGFHPDLASWFAARLGAPTPFQYEAWQAIRRGEDTLLAAPTGSGKTFAAFWVALDGLWRRADAGDNAGNLGGGGHDSHDLGDHTEVLYVSPLKALSNDIEKNLQRPLREMRDRVFHDRLKTIDVRVGLRTGDTSAKDRAAMNRKPPHIVVTTPESLYLLLTSKGGRHMLRHVRTVIVDEVHALLPDRRGAHLMLSLQRLEALCGHRPQRIGLSATQKPIERVAHFLVGSQRDGSQGEGSPRPCTVVDVGLRRSMDLAVVLPGSPLQAVMPLEVWEEVYAQLEAHIQAHRTTLIFVNTRRMAERVAHRLAQNLGEELVAAHHGSMSRERRLRAETALKEGRLKVMVATASLELGIDIGEVDLCIQLGTPKTISSFVQRMGRSGHFIGGTPKGRIFPLTRDELVEAAALMRCVKRGELDTLILPRQPLDILAQQIVAEVACRECGESDLYALLHEAAMYQSLSYAAYQGVVAMLSEGFTTRRGRQGAYIHRDQVHGRLRARRGARLAAITSGGAIPDTFDIEVRLEPGDLVLGSVNEDFAIESMPGDIFQLGNRSWRILRVEANALRVADAGNEPPGIPFWLGEAPGRSAEFSEALSAIREGVSLALGDITAAELSDGSEIPGPDQVGHDSPNAPWRLPALNWLDQECGLHADAALQIVDYLASAQLALGALPTTRRLMLERFFDEGGAMHLVLHAPLGSRLNRALGLALRKRFCRKFNFELQAAATEDAIILSLGASHSFPLHEVWQYLHADSVRPILIQALLAAPMFEVRWRWNASRALAILRNRAGKRTPPPIQRLQAQDLAALVFPDSIACPENLGGDREIPDHPLVNQTVDDCLYEAMDVEALEALLRDIAAGRLTLLEKDVREPSPLAEAVLSARPYAFLDDAPLEERRTRAVKVRADWTPTRTDALARLDPMAVIKVRAQAAPSWRDADELHDALLTCGFLAEAEILRTEMQPAEPTASRAPHLLTPGDFTDTEASPRLLADLSASGRAFVLPAQGQRPVLWYAAERRHEIAAAFGAPEDAAVAEKTTENNTEHIVDPSAATRELLRGRLEVSGPVTEAALLTLTGWPHSVLQVALLGLEAEGFAFRGEFPQALRLASEAPHDEMLLPAWCDRHLLARIHRLARDTVRRQADPVPTTVFQQGLFAWHRMFAQDRLEGPEGLAEALLKLEGCDAPLAAWEQSILPLRVAGYRSDWLDSLLLSGRFHWRRKVRRSENVDGIAARPSFHRGLPIAFYAAGNEPELPAIPEAVLGHAALVIEHLRAHGAAFWRDIARVHRQPLEIVREGLKEAVARGWVACDGLTGLRALLTTSAKRSVPGPEALDRAGRWYLITQNPTIDSNSDREGEAETWAKRLLLRYGFLFRRLAETESEALPWRELLRALRRFEDRGEIRGGRFVTGFSGEQFALPDAAAALHSIARRQGIAPHESMRFMTLSAHDPLNLQGLLTPGPRLTAQGRNRVLYEGGEPVAGIEAEEFKAIKASDADQTKEWQARLRNPSPPEKTLVP